MKKSACPGSAASALAEQGRCRGYAAAGVTAFAWNVPRITRAQSMELLSSQAISPAPRVARSDPHLRPRAADDVMTAAGTVGAGPRLSKIMWCVNHYGVASACRPSPRAPPRRDRLGDDVRPATKGSRSIASAPSRHGRRRTRTSRPETRRYARRDVRRVQSASRPALIAETIQKQDIVITTALIPGRKAPVLAARRWCAPMKPGPVIIDLASGGGNCPLSSPTRSSTSAAV